MQIGLRMRCSKEVVGYFDPRTHLKEPNLQELN